MRGNVYFEIMGRPREFDEDQVVHAAVEIFAQRSYDGTSVDDLVNHLGVHRGSLYKTFGSKRGLYLTALRRHVDNDVTALAAAVSSGAPAEEHVILDRQLGSGRVALDDPQDEVTHEQTIRRSQRESQAVETRPNRSVLAPAPGYTRGETWPT